MDFMAKNRNKGFSIVEIVVAIAILTLLLTPILKQLAVTMSTNRKAKEQQYANENAEYVLQYVQNSSLEELGNTTVNDDIYCIGKNIQDGEPGSLNPKHTCYIYVMEGGVISASPEKMVDYSTYEYTLNDVTLGSRNTEYTRTVVLDDISNRIKTLEHDSGVDADLDGNSDIYGYKISYNNESATAPFELTSEGSIVQYDANGYVTAIVCERYRGNSSADPNELNMGNMHNFDYTQMALINGYSTDYDQQAKDDFYADIMDGLKNSSVPADKLLWQNAISNDQKIDTSTYLADLKKLTTISITDDVTASLYRVKVGVSYTCTLFGSTVTKSYDVYGQDFPYTDPSDKVPPEVYFEYQPLVLGTTNKSSEISLTYAENEYIVIDNQVQDAKIYMVKPTWDEARAYVYNIDKASDISSSTEPKQEDEYYYFNEAIIATAGGIYYPNGEATRDNFLKVNVNIASANEIQEDVNEFIIYTNMTLTDAVKSEDNTLCANPQFTLNNSSAVNTIFATTSYDVKPEYLKSMADEDTKGNRLYTATITLKPKTENVNTVVLTGAKGAN